MPEDSIDTIPRELCQDLANTLTLQTQLQACESRIRLAAEAFSALRERLLVLVLPLPLAEVAEVLGRVGRIRNLLEGDRDAS